MEAGGVVAIAPKFQDLDYTAPSRKPRASSYFAGCFLN